MHDSKPRTTDGQIYESRKDSTKREWTLQSHSSHDETTNHRKYMRTQSSATNRVVSNSSSSQQQRQNGEKKAVKDTKKPLRIWTDWSEFQSSTGKTYFYNCKTEVSQWEKPKGWPKDDSSTHRTSTTSIPSVDRSKKESISQTSSTIRTRHKMDEIPSIDKKIASNSHHQNGTIHHRTHKDSVQSNEQIINHTNHRLSSPGDDSSRMSFSSTSSKESSSLINHTNDITLNSSLTESVSTPISDLPTKPFETTLTPINGHTTRNSNSRITNGLTQTVPLESPPATISKVERDQEIQKFYRAELIQHLTDWPSTQLEKQCLKLFDDYYGYSAKISTAFTELKALKSNFRVVHIKRNVLTQKLLRCQKHAREREEDKPL